MAAVFFVNEVRPSPISVIRESNRCGLGIDGGQSSVHEARPTYNYHDSDRAMECIGENVCA